MFSIFVSCVSALHHRTSPMNQFEVSRHAQFHLSPTESDSNTDREVVEPEPASFFIAPTGPETNIGNGRLIQSELDALMEPNPIMLLITQRNEQIKKEMNTPTKPEMHYEGEQMDKEYLNAQSKHLFQSAFDVYNHIKQNIASSFIELESDPPVPEHHNNTHHHDHEKKEPINEGKKYEVGPNVLDSTQRSHIPNANPPPSEEDQKRASNQKFAIFFFIVFNVMVFMGIFIFLCCTVACMQRICGCVDRVKGKRGSEVSLNSRDHDDIKKSLLSKKSGKSKKSKATGKSNNDKESNNNSNLNETMKSSDLTNITLNSTTNEKPKLVS